MAQCLSTPDPSLSPTHLSIRRGRATTTHYTHHQVSLMVLRNTTLDVVRFMVVESHSMISKSVPIESPYSMSY